MKMPHSDSTSHLEENIDHDDEDRESEVKQQPDLHRLDVGGAGEAGGHRKVDRGQDHHAGDVNGYDQAVPIVSTDVVGGLVDDVHQDGGQKGPPNSPQLLPPPPPPPPARLDGTL